MQIPSARIVFSESDKQEILRSIEESLSTGQLTLGKNGASFEEEFQKITGTGFAVAVNSGTSALEIVLRSLDVREKEVLVPTNTFFATPAAVCHAGGIVKFIDIDPATLAPNMDLLTQNVTNKTAGIIVVHIGGMITPEMDDLVNFCNESGIFLLEDAAHAHGSSFNGKPAGSFGIAGTFSFYPTKVITAAEGGMIVTHDARLAGEARKYRDQGKVSFLENRHDRLGHNWRMSEIHAAIGRVHLRRLPEFIKERNEIAGRYHEGVKRIPRIRPLAVDPRCRTNYYKYIAVLEDGIDRALLKKELRENHGVSLSGEVYELPCHLQPVFLNGRQGGCFPAAEDFCRRHVCLPVFQGMQDEEIDHVLSALKTELEKFP